MAGSYGGFNCKWTFRYSLGSVPYQSNSAANNYVETFFSHYAVMPLFQVVFLLKLVLKRSERFTHIQLAVFEKGREFYFSFRVWLVRLCR